ncbi:MAG: hypothetical protein RRY53_02085 [Pseudoflavonifractor sp.]
MNCKPCVLCLPLCLALTSCAALPVPREAEQMRPVQVLAVDAADSGVKVTAVSTTREDTRTYSAAADTVEAACAAIQTAATATLFYGHTEQLLAGEGLARRGLAELLTYVAQSGELRPDTALFLVRGSAAEGALGSASPVSPRLAAIAARGEVPTVRDVLVRLTRDGTAEVPILALYKEGVLICDGYAVLRGDRWEA